MVKGLENLQAERMFVTVLELGSFSRAAERLGTSSGQASKLVSKLEADLGVQLIKRTTRALSATEAGQAYFDGLRSLVAELDALEASVRMASGRPAGRVRLTAPLTFGVTRLAPLLLRFADLYPDIQLDVQFSDRAAHVVDEGFDLALRIGTPTDSGLILRRLGPARMVTVASPTYLRQRPAPLTPAGLAAHLCILDGNHRDPSQWHYHDPATGEALHIPVSGRLKFANGEVCLAAALEGLGVAHLPTFIAGPALREGRLQSLLTAYEAPPLSLFLLYPPARHLALKVRSLIDFLAAEFDDQPEWDQGWS